MWWRARCRRANAMRGALVVTTLALMGCDVHHAITVKVRDPRAVAVEIETRRGRETILPPGGERIEVPLPSDALAEVVSVAEGRSVARVDAGAIEVRCPHCNEYPEMLAVEPDGSIPLKDAATDAIGWGRDGLRVRFVHFRIGRGRRGGRARRPAFEVTLVTPANNVVEITDHRTGSPNNVWPRVGLGVFAVAIGAVVTGVGLGVPGLSGSRGVFVGVGAAWGALGGLVAGSGIYELAVTDTTVLLYPTR
jgi:hypothetical protein